MSVEYRKGDLLKSKCKYMVHQTNCLGVMGGGIALTVKNRFPNVYKEYRMLCNKYSNYLLGDILTVKLEDGRYIVNLFGQLGIGHGVETDYAAFSSGLYKLRSLLEHRNELNGVEVGFPYLIGCGLAGGDWGIVEPMIIEILGEYKVVFYDFN